MPSSAIRIDLTVLGDVPAGVTQDIADEAARLLFDRTGNVPVSVHAVLTAGVEPFEQPTHDKIFDPDTNYALRPSQIVVTPLGAGQVLLAWDAPPTFDWVVGYYVLWGTSGDDQQYVIVSDTQVTLTTGVGTFQVMVMPFYGHPSLGAIVEPFDVS